MSQKTPTELTIQTEIVQLEDGSKRSRPVLVTCLLGAAGSNSDPVPHPLALIDEEGYGDPMNGFDKGHIVARHFIGKKADVSGNIVPLDPTFNRSGLWKELERSLAQDIKNGKSVMLTVQIFYAGASPLVPSGLRVTAWDIKNAAVCTFNEAALDKLDFTPPEISPVQLSKTDLCEQYGKELYECVVTFEEYCQKNLGSSYDIGKELLTGAYIGPFGVPRPYQCLDFAVTMAKTNAIQVYLKPLKIMNSQVFGHRQRALIQLLNRIRNDGWLVSDDPNDPIKGHLTVGAGADAGHVDHIRPKAQAGANAFSNARLISRKHNETTKDTQKKVEVEMKN
jgi:hypothetical protein